MTATYWVLISDQLMDSSPQWPDGFRPVEPDGYEHPGMRWWKCQDDDAPESLDGTRVELAVSHVDGKPVITGRRPAL